MREIDITRDALVDALLVLAETGRVCVLDSCGVGHLGSHLLIAGIDPVRTAELSLPDVDLTLGLLEKRLSADVASIFTLSYDFGRKLARVPTHHQPTMEPDVWLAQFRALIVHDYSSSRTVLLGDEGEFDAIEQKLRDASHRANRGTELGSWIRSSNLTREEYTDAVDVIKDRIRDGDTYQTNLTQQFRLEFHTPPRLQQIYRRLTRDHPAPFAAFLRRDDSVVISASPERFFRVDRSRNITTSPIKGTRPRSSDRAADDRLRRELLTSEKDRAENTMIVDLLRNDLGCVCEYGSVRVEKLCDLEEHPTLFHLVSTVSGRLRADAGFSEIIRALFPCGSITGAPKISTMKIIDEIEPVARGLSMGAIGYYLPDAMTAALPGLATCDLSVAIRTMVIRCDVGTFNVGGGVVIDSEPAKEYDESLLKALALLNALGAN